MDKGEQKRKNKRGEKELTNVCQKNVLFAGLRELKITVFIRHANCLTNVTFGWTFGKFPLYINTHGEFHERLKKKKLAVSTESWSVSSLGVLRFSEACQVIALEEA